MMEPNWIKLPGKSSNLSFEDAIAVNKVMAQSS